MIDPDLTPGTQRRARGHNFLPPRRALNKVPALYSTEQVPLEDKVVHLHYFSGPYDAWGGTRPPSPTSSAEEHEP